MVNTGFPPWGKVGDRNVKVLVVEDERQLNKMIRDYLESLGWVAFAAYSGSEALILFASEEPDFVLLDIMIPALDGLDVMRRIREKSGVPVIFLTAMAEETDKLIGLELGADDYLTKPFSLKELAARMRTVMRRVSAEDVSEGKTLVVGDLLLDPLRRHATRKKEPLILTSVQFDILHGFMRQPGRVFTRNEIQGFFQDNAWEGYDRTIDVHIKNIRRVLEPNRSTPRYIETVRGVGYRLMEIG